MLTTLLRRLFAPALPTHDSVPLCVPEWSEPMAERHPSIWWQVKPYTMAGVERVVALCQSIAYLEKHGIAGDIVECGVWKGGGMMASALALLACDSTRRQLWFYDTFTGMTMPAPVDVDWHGRSARELLRESEALRAACSLNDVKQAMMQTRYPWEKMVFVQGKVEQTIPKHRPEQIALLRLDTAWYESTQHTLAHLYPQVADGGILLVDGYAQWQGAKKAVDGHFGDLSVDPDLRTVDKTARLQIKRAQNAAKLAA